MERPAKKNRWGKRDWLAIRMAYRHGLRASELVGLEWNDLDLDRGIVLIQRAKDGIMSTRPRQHVLQAHMSANQP
ncbi:MAG: tyrosine-type recombinase/integrase [Cyanobacteria bacterium]|nr:tyrosine-type recombinase/integrase [Cyanobacteria bacterium bin.275]